MQFTPWDNPMGTDEFEFIECAAPNPVETGTLFARMGFITIARHRHKQVTLYRQDEINFILNAEPDSFRPALRAAARAEHLRHRLSGPGRQGRLRVSRLAGRLAIRRECRPGRTQHPGNQGHGKFADLLL